MTPVSTLTEEQREEMATLCAKQALSLIEAERIVFALAPRVLTALMRAEAERDAERARLRKLAERYRHCRHACIDCFCTVEARAVLPK